jgi:crossover junction endodeoxyribonuclease RusA
MSLSFTVLGTPISQGSKRHVGRGIMVESSKKLRPWRALVSAEAQHAIQGRPPLQGPLAVDLYFRFARPKRHYRTGRHAHELRADAPVFHSIAPDADKLCRSIFDSLTDAGVIRDDGQIALVRCRKAYCSTAPSSLPGVDVTVQPLPEGDTA